MTRSFIQVEEKYSHPNWDEQIVYASMKVLEVCEWSQDCVKSCVL